MKRKTEEIVNAVRNAGVVGSEDPGVPSYMKLNTTADLIIANGSECEPLVHSDKALLRQRPDLVLDGVKLAMESTGAKNAVIAVKACDEDIVACLQEVLSEEPSIGLHLLEDYYPVGDEHLLVYEITKKLVPQGGNSLDIGIVVDDVLGFAQIYQGVHGKPVTERPVTICGEVESPQVAWIPIGTPYDEVIRFAGGLKLQSQDVVILDGGPMKGKIVSNLKDGIGKSTCAVLILPKNHLVSKVKQKTLSQMVKEHQGVSGESSKVAELCPRYQLGHDIHPDRAFMSLHFPSSIRSSEAESAFHCNGCSLCDYLGSDISNFSPRLVYEAMAKELKKRGVKGPSRRSDIQVRKGYNNNRVSLSHLRKRIGVEQYEKKVMPLKEKKTPAVVRIPLLRHVGRPARPIVFEGQDVQMGDVIAFSPPSEMGTTCHASISGKVGEVNENWIEIVKGRKS